jgi:alanine racemase
MPVVEEARYSDISDRGLLRPTWAEVDLDAVRGNLSEILRVVGLGLRVYASLKGDAYGHGCVEVAEAAREAGVYGLALANPYECVEIRRRGIDLPILLYAGILPDLAEVIVEYQITPSLTDIKLAEALSRRAPQGYEVFVKVDCGLQRAGLYAEEALPLIEQVLRLPRLVVAGIYTHMHDTTAPTQDRYARWQFSRFTGLIGRLEQAGIDIPVRLAASSPFVLRYPGMYLNAVDPGRLIYGITADGPASFGMQIRPALVAFKSKIVEVKEGKLWGSSFLAEAPFDPKRVARFGVVPAGWGDGLHRAYGHGGPALVRGRRTSVLGPVHYEHSRVDLTRIPEARIGDEVVFLGRQGTSEITMHEVSKLCNMLAAQVPGTMCKHVPVIYLRDGRVYHIVRRSRVIDS